MEVQRSFATHDGTFHADEVTACALLLLFDYIDKDKILRSRDKEKIAQCEYVCDVGGEYNPDKKRFDHHQISYQGDMSSAGMILLYFKEQKILDQDTYDFFNKSLILGVDAHDNGRASLEVGVCSFSQIVSNFVPKQHDVPEKEQSEAFFAALGFVLGHLKRLWERYLYMQECKGKVLAAMQVGKEYLLFDEPMPWIDAFFDHGGEKHPAQFLIMPSGSHWKLRGIPPTSNERMKVRKPLPMAWAGLLDGDLKKASGIEGAIFCHKGRFISVWETKQDVLKALDIVLKEEKL